MPNKPLQPTPLRGAAELARWVDASRRPIGARLSPRFGPRSAAPHPGQPDFVGPNFVCPASRVNRAPLGRTTEPSGSSK